ncbi:hypothetical protein ILUMI_27261 [Ignelater luminosus]|uniref:Uncharacterized protein n=1 Tax=Ignelater luminosus TaxID=2038154 RepID=A0A8K0C5G4_IGNLU|nr:hypothetical protein ILUMI_27261 [Ignelater luminosus]
MASLRRPLTEVLISKVEVKSLKTKRPARELEGDNAVGYVQLKRERIVYSVKAKLAPEHRVRKKANNILVKMNEKNADILNCQCLDFAASAVLGFKSEGTNLEPEEYMKLASSKLDVEAQITAFRLYETAQCKTCNGALFESILEALKQSQSKAMIRGRLLGDDVLHIVKRQTKT